MVDPSNRQALRRGIPWTFLGFVVLLSSVLVWVVLLELELLADVAVVTVLARGLGLLGAGLFALGLSAFVRARRAGPGGRWLDAALILWLAELGLRVAWLVAPDHLRPFAVVLRLCLAGGAIAALASWMMTVFKDDASPRVYVSWSLTRLFFLLQLAAVLLLASVPGATRWVPLNFELASVWVLFAVPWIVLYVALRRTMRELARQHSLADVLAS